MSLRRLLLVVLTCLMTVALAHIEGIHRSAASNDRLLRLNSADRDALAEQWRQRHARIASSPVAHAFRHAAASTLSSSPAEVCAVCRNATQLLVDLFMTPTDHNITVLALDVACDLAFKSNATWAALCKSLASIAVDVGAHVLDEVVGNLHFNVPVMLCADVLKVCVEPCCTAKNKAEQVRLSFASESSAVAAIGTSTAAMRVSWTSLNQAPWRVAYRRVDTATWLYGAPPTVGTTTVGGWIGSLYHSVIANLTANTTYEYQVEAASGSSSSSSADGTSFEAAGPFTFRTLPANAGTPERPLRFAALADMGLVHSEDTIARLAALVDLGELDLVLHYGDMGYADGDEPVWDDFFRVMEPITSRVAYMTTPGNHECLWNFSMYQPRMRMPLAAHGAPEDAMWYNFDVNGIKFVMLDTESYIDTPEFKADEFAWLRRRLQDAREAQQFVFVAHHRPLYCTPAIGDHIECFANAELLRDVLENTYNEFRVPFVTVGHLHNYERTWPVVNGTVTAMNYSNPAAPVYQVNGAAGNKEGQGVFVPNAANWSAYRSSDVGFSLMTLHVSESPSATSARVGVLHSQFIRSQDSAVLDDFTLTKEMS